MKKDKTQGFEKMRSRISYVNGERRVDNSDFSWKRIRTVGLTVWLIYIGLIAVLSFIDIAKAPTEHRNWEKRAAANAVMSSLSDTDRAIMAEMFEGYNLNDDNLFRVGDEPPATPGEELRVCLSIVFHPITVAIVIVLIMYFMALGYYLDSREEYFLADFPEVRPGKWLFPLLTCAAFPFYLYSWHRMCRWRKWKRERGEPEIMETTTAEGKKDSTSEIVTVNYEDLETSLAFDDSPEAKEAFLEFCKPIKQLNLQCQLDLCKQEIEQIKRALRRDGEEIRANQARLRKLEIQRMALEGVDEESGLWPEDLDAIVEDWQELKRMRGVTAVTVTPDEIAVLKILVRVRIRCGYDIFDRGDWCIRIGKHLHYDCVCVRTGRCDGAVNGGEYNTYQYAEPTFCFGNTQEEDIQAYLEQGQIMTAISLMIASLHTINEEDVEDFQKEYRRVLPISAASRKGE